MKKAHLIFGVLGMVFFQSSISIANNIEESVLSKHLLIVVPGTLQKGKGPSGPSMSGGGVDQGPKQGPSMSGNGGGMSGPKQSPNKIENGGNIGFKQGPSMGGNISQQGPSMGGNGGKHSPKQGPSMGGNGGQQGSKQGPSMSGNGGLKGPKQGPSMGGNGGQTGKNNPTKLHGGKGKTPHFKHPYHYSPSGKWVAAKNNKGFYVGSNYGQYRSAIARSKHKEFRPVYQYEVVGAIGFIRERNIYLITHTHYKIDHLRFILLERRRARKISEVIYQAHLNRLALLERRRASIALIVSV